jgi:aminoglycoside 3-N-acetyltransferase
VTLVDDFRRLGIAAGDRVVVHSSLRRVAAAPDELAGALLEVLEPEGLLVVPTFTYGREPFKLSTPGRTGALAEHVRQLGGAVRSRHPTHSVAAVGPGATALCAGHEQLDATQVGTPLERLAAGGGHILLLGVGHVSNTTVHVGEFKAQAPYLDIPFRPDWPRLGYSRFPGCSRAFGVVERGLRERGAVRDGDVGAAEAQLVRGLDVIWETVALLDGDAASLLCADPACYRCTRARARLTRAGGRGRGAAADRAR